MARKRRRIKFSPFRMSKRMTQSIIVCLGVFLIAIFAVPFRGACDRRGTERKLDEVVASFDGTPVHYGEVIDVRRRYHRIFRRPLTQDEGILRLAEYQEALKAGIRVSDAEVVDAIRNQIFPRRVRVEYAIAENQTFAKDVKIGDADIAKLYEEEKAERFRRPDNTFRPLDEVRDELADELKTRKASPAARQALEEYKEEVELTLGSKLETAFSALAKAHNVTFGETKLLTPRTAKSQLQKIGEAPRIEQRVFAEPFGKPSEPLPLAGGWCIFRVVMRSRGFGPDGAYYPEEEAWGRERFGVVNRKQYSELLLEMSVTEPELEQTIREDIALVVLPSVAIGSAAELPRTTLKARYRRDNTQAQAAYFALRASDFTPSVHFTDEELRDFYERHKNIRRSESTVGYLQPARVRLEYVLGRSTNIADSLDDRELRAYYDRHTAFFEGKFADVRDDVRKRLADEKLRTAITEVADRAGALAQMGRDPDLAALASQQSRATSGAFVSRRTPPFAANEVDLMVPALRGAKLADVLFGERGEQYAVAGTTPKEGQHVISDEFTCDAGRLFFRLLERIPSRSLPFDEIGPDTRTQLVRDIQTDKAFAKAREQAANLRTRVYQAAFEQFATYVGTKPLTTEFLKANTPVPPFGQTVPALYDQLAVAEPGNLSDIVQVGERLALARLATRDDLKGIQCEVIAFAPDALKDTFAPSDYALQARYDDDPYAYLPKPEPIPLEQVKADIQKLLVNREALDLAAERIAKALADLAGAEKPDIAAAAKAHKLTLHRTVPVDLAKTEATPHIGKAAGFHDAVSALKPGEVSKALASADGRFLFLLRSRDGKKATIDVAAALYEPLRKEAAVDEKAVTQYYNDHRDTAYVTGDAIQAPPKWADVQDAARAQARSLLTAEWAKKPTIARFTQVRDSLVEEAFRSIPTSMPLSILRELKLSVRAVGPFPLSNPDPTLGTAAETLAAVRALKPGELSPPLATRDGAMLAFATERKPGGQARAQVAVFRAASYLQLATQPAPAAVNKHYEDNKETYRLPERATVEFLFADIASRQKPIEKALTNDECRRHFEQNRTTTYSGAAYDTVRPRVRVDLARQRATIEARRAAADAFEALQGKDKPAEASLAPLATLHKLTHETTAPFAIADPAQVPTIGQVRNIADDLADAKPGTVVGRVVESTLGFAVLRVAQRISASIPPLADVRDRVVRDVKLARARAAAQKAAQAFRKAAAASSFEKAAAKADPAPRILQTALLDARRFAPPGQKPIPALTDAVFALDKPGLTPVAPAADRARFCVALVSERKPDELLTIDAVAVRRWDVSTGVETTTDAQARKHYEDNKETFRAPEQLQVACLALSYDELAKAMATTDDELRTEYKRSVDAGETYYRDWSVAPRVVYLPFERARDTVQKRVLNSKAEAEAKKRLAEAVKELGPKGAKADFQAYAAVHKPFQATTPAFFDKEQKGIEPLGFAPRFAAAAFAAPKDKVLGPVSGTDGACLYRRLELRPSAIPPFDEVKAKVEADLRRLRGVERALAAAAKLRERIAPALADAKDGRAAFAAAVQEKPFPVQFPQPVAVTLSRPFYPEGAGWNKTSFITGLGVKPDLVRAVFRQRPSSLTPVVDDPDRSASYVALLTRFSQPDAPRGMGLFETQYRLGELGRRMARASWARYLSEQLDENR